MDLADEGYDLLESLPRKEMFGLASQMRRAFGSVPANIAEAHGRLHTGDYLHHVSMSLGSLAEVETFMLLGLRRRYFTEAQMSPVWPRAQEVGRLTRRLAQALERRRQAARSQSVRWTPPEAPSP
jgi:four helix bundle protein